MTNTTNLYYRYATDKTDLGCWYTETDRDNYVVVIRNGKDLREHCQQFGSAEVVALDNLNPGPHKFRRFVENLREGGYVDGCRKIDLSAQFARARELMGL